MIRPCSPISLLTHAGGDAKGLCSRTISSSTSSLRKTVGIFWMRLLEMSNLLRFNLQISGKANTSCIIKTYHNQSSKLNFLKKNKSQNFSFYYNSPVQFSLVKGLDWTEMQPKKERKKNTLKMPSHQHFPFALNFCQWNRLKLVQSITENDVSKYFLGVRKQQKSKMKCINTADTAKSN